MKVSSSDITKPSEEPAAISYKLRRLKNGSSTKKAGSDITPLLQHVSQWPKLELNPNQHVSQESPDTGAEPSSKVRKLAEHRKKALTIQIFKHSLQSKKDYTPSEGKTKATPQNQIKKDDPPTMVKYLLEKTTEDYRNSKRDKTHGIMYINELWENNYEKKTMKAAKLNEALLRLAKGEPKKHTQFVKDLIQADLNFDITQPGRTFKSLSPVDVKRSTHYQISPKAGEKRDMKILLNPCVSPINSQATLDNSPEPEYLTSRSSLPKLSETPFTPQQPKHIHNTSRSTSPSSLGALSPGIKVNDNIAKVKSTPIQEESYMDQIVTKAGLVPRLQIHSGETRPSRVKSGKKSSGPSVKRTEDAMRKTVGQGFTSGGSLTMRETAKTKMFIQNKGQDLFELINRCDTELEGKNEWISTLKNFHKTLVTAKTGVEKKPKEEPAATQNAIKKMKTHFMVRQNSNRHIRTESNEKVLIKEKKDCS